MNSMKGHGIYGSAASMLAHPPAEAETRHKPRTGPPTTCPAPPPHPNPRIALTARTGGEPLRISSEWPHPTQWLDKGNPGIRQWLAEIRAMIARNPDFRTFLRYEMMGNEPVTREEATQIADNLRRDEDDYGFGTRFRRP